MLRIIPIPCHLVDHLSPQAPHAVFSIPLPGFYPIKCRTEIFTWLHFFNVLHHSCDLYQLFITGTDEPTLHYLLHESLAESSITTSQSRAVDDSLTPSHPTSSSHIQPINCASPLRPMLHPSKMNSLLKENEHFIARDP